MPDVKLLAGLPKGDANGLDALAKPLLENPRGAHVIVAMVDSPEEVHTHTEQGDLVVPKMRIIAGEMLEGDEAAQALKLLRRRFATRTGNLELFDEDDD